MVDISKYSWWCWCWWWWWWWCWWWSWWWWWSSVFFRFYSFWAPVPGKWILSDDSHVEKEWRPCHIARSSCGAWTRRFSNFGTVMWKNDWDWLMVSRIGLRYIYPPVVKRGNGKPAIYDLYIPIETSVYTCRWNFRCHISIGNFLYIPVVSWLIKLVYWILRGIF